MSFGFKSVGHFFASALGEIKAVAQFFVNHASQIEKGLEVGGAVISLVDPALAPLATTIERAGEAVLGDILALIDKAGDAAAEKGLDYTIDAAAVAEFKQLLADIKKFKPSTVAAPAGLPTTTTSA